MRSEFIIAWEKEKENRVNRLLEDLIYIIKKIEIKRKQGKKDKKK